MKLSTLTTNGRYIGTALNDVQTGTLIEHDVRGNIGIEPTDIGTKSIRLVGDVGATIGDRNGGSSMSCEKPGALFTLARGRHAAIEHIRLTGRTDQTGVLWKAGKCSALVANSFENLGIGVDVACNGFALLACEIQRSIFVECGTGIRIYAGDGGTGLPAAKTNSSTGLEIALCDMTGGQVGIEILTCPWQTLIRSTSIQAAKKAGIIVRGGRVMLQNVYVETGDATHAYPALVVLGTAEVTLIGGQYQGGVYCEPTANIVNVTGVDLTNRARYMTADVMRNLGIIQ